jgi:adenylate kinase
VVHDGLPDLKNAVFCYKLFSGLMPRLHTRSQVIILLGPPGSGKGTQATRLSAELQIPAISTGEMLRRECQSGSPLGNAVKTVLASGQLVNDALVNQVVDSRLRNCDCDPGCILDGYPRTVSQARFLDNLLRSLHKRPPLVFDFEISSGEIIARIGRRRQCTECGRIFSIDSETGVDQLVCDRDGAALIQRADDNREVIRERLWQYERNAAQLIRYYRSQDYHPISAAREAEEISDELLNILAANWPTPILSRAAATSHRPLHL